MAKRKRRKNKSSTAKRARRATRKSAAKSSGKVLAKVKFAGDKKACRGRMLKNRSGKGRHGRVTCASTGEMKKKG